MLDLDPASLRDWMAAVGLLRLVSETTEHGRLVWNDVSGRYRLNPCDWPDDMADRGVAWIAAHQDAWSFGERRNVDFDDKFWRDQALAVQGIAVNLWCAVASDAVWHRDGKKLQASRLEYGHGGGHQHWLASMRGFLSQPLSIDDFGRLLTGQRDESMSGDICRWDPACERNHAYRDQAPTKDRMSQDQFVNMLAAIGLASCPSAPTRRGLVTPLVLNDELTWPVWLDPLRIADLDAALCCGWHWPTMHGRRWLAGKLYCFSRGELREPPMIRK